MAQSMQSGRPFVVCIADAVEKDRQAAPAPTAPPVWPGLEGEGPERAAKVWITTYHEASERGVSYADASRAACTAEAAYLWRAMVASLPTHTSVVGGFVQVGCDFVSRSALAALADPYDGGGM